MGSVEVCGAVNNVILFVSTCQEVVEEKESVGNST